MLRKLLAAAFLLGLGYIVGLLFGFRTAVVDYVENDASQIEAMADDIYPSAEDGVAELPEEVREKLKEANGTDEASRGFQ